MQETISQTPQLIVLPAGPSGSGKNTLVDCLFKQRTDLSRVVSSTTRVQREGEEHGVHYHFYTRDAFEDAWNRGEILERDNFAGHWYGMGKAALEYALIGGRIPVKDVTLKGVSQTRRSFSGVFSVFLMPRLHELERRIRARRPEPSDADVHARLATAEEEMATWESYCDIAVDSVDGRIADIVAPEVSRLIDRRLAELRSSIQASIKSTR